MALDKKVDVTQLETDLAGIADAIRARGHTTEKLSFPDGFVTAINNFKTPKIYGISRDITNSSPAWTRTDDAVGKTATASVGATAGSSDFNDCYPWSGIVRETLSTGDVMVKIPKFWYRRYRDGDIEFIKISDSPASGFTLHPAFNHANVEAQCVYVGAYSANSECKSLSGYTPVTAIDYQQTRSRIASEKGAGWGITDISTFSALQMLILVEFANNNVQAVIGKGSCDWPLLENHIIKTGSCDSVPNLTGIPEGTNGEIDVIWRGIEGLWGNVNELADGLVYFNNTYYACNDPAKYNISAIDDDYVKENYTALSYSIPSSQWGYVARVGLDTTLSHIMLPTLLIGDFGSEYSDVYMCDFAFGSYSGVDLPRGFQYGGGNNDSDKAGLFAYTYRGGGDSGEKVDSYRLLYIPQQ